MADTSTLPVSSDDYDDADLATPSPQIGVHLLDQFIDASGSTRRSATRPDGAAVVEDDEGSRTSRRTCGHLQSR